MADSVFDRLKKALSGRYTIERELGAGGMATVYLAHDLKHDRKVAIKVMRPELSAILGGERFLCEIRIAAKLNHPHILALHDSGDADGFLYYVMPHVEGESLRSKIEREKQLSIDDAMGLTRQVAAALDYAHEQGVIHRDIKPENILLHRGDAVVADFGIALAVTAAGGERLTETGLSLGTPEYMSPEQATGGERLDGRTDVYSLGAVLYEMVTGEPPQTGATVQAVIAKLLSQPPMKPRVVRDSIPEAMERAILKALEKVPADRFESSTDLVAALTEEQPESEADVNSIVVLPFENLSPDPDNAFFADGLTEEIIADLSRVRSLQVISRTSAMAFKDTTKTIPTIAQELNVRYVMEGSVRRAGSNLRITAQLIDAKSDSHLWAEKYSGLVDDVFEIQENVSRSIVEALKIELSTDEAEKLVLRPIENVDAYEYYLSGLSALYQITEEGMLDARRYFQLAVDIVGDNATLYSEVAYTYFWLANIGIRIEENLARAEEYVRRALTLEPDLPKARALLGNLTMFYHGDLGNVKEAAGYLKMALAANPKEFQALVGLISIHVYVGRTPEAYALVERMRQVDPLDPFAVWSLGGLYFFDGKYDLALKEFRKRHELEPEAPSWHLWYAVSLAYNDRIDEAFAVIDRSARVTPHNTYTKFGLLQLNGLRGDAEAVRNALTGDFRSWCSERLWSTRVVAAFALLDEKEEALDWLEHAVNSGFINYPLLAHGDPWLENIRCEERFKELMVRVKREWEEFEM